MGLAESFGGSVEGAPNAGKAMGGMVLGLAAGFSFHESIDSDEQAIILNRGRVKMDHELLTERFATGDARWARHILENKKATSKKPDEDEAEYAKIYNSGSHFKFFNLRSIRKIKTNVRTNDLPAQPIPLERGLWILDSRARWKIGSHGQCAARAMLRHSSLDEVAQQVTASTASAARESIMEMDKLKPDALFKQSHVFAGIMERCGSALEHESGVVLMDYEIVTFAPAPAEVQRRIRFEDPSGRPVHPRDVSPVGLHAVSGAVAGAEAS